MSSSKMKTLESVLNSLANFLAEFDPVINVCMVDFFTDGVYESALTPEVQQVLSELDDETIANLPKRLREAENFSNPLDHLLRRIRQHSIEALGVAESYESFLQRQPQFKEMKDSPACALLHHLDRIMGEKKMHEVVALAELVHSLHLGQDSVTRTLVDIGSGKGYLSHIMSEVFLVNVLGIDAAEGNTLGAQKRQKSLEKMWSSLLRRAEVRAAGEGPLKRGKHWRARRRHDEVCEEEERDAFINSADSGRFSSVTGFVNTETDLLTMLREHFGSDKVQNFGVVGLHTCGNLATNSMKIFLSNPSAAFLANVGCCYHHLNEEFYRNPNLPDCDNDLCNSDPGFPMSATLRARRFALGRNARMLAAQPTDRMADNSQVLIKRTQEGTTDFHQQQVGKIARKCETFKEYCKAAFMKIGAKVPVSQSQIESVEKEFSGKDRQHLLAFYQLRSLFGSLVEGLILLDRLVFLLQKEEILDASLVKLFDPVVSPRCYVLVASKKLRTNQE